MGVGSGRRRVRAAATAPLRTSPLLPYPPAIATQYQPHPPDCPLPAFVNGHVPSSIAFEQLGQHVIEREVLSFDLALRHPLPIRETPGNRTFWLIEYGSGKKD